MEDKIVILEDLFKLGEIQGEHKSNWCDEYNREEECNTYLDKITTLISTYNIIYDKQLNDFREYGDEEEVYLMDKMGADMLNILKDHLMLLMLVEVKLVR